MIQNMNAALVLDIVLVLGILVSAIIGARHGLLKSVWKITSIVITIVLVIALKTPFTTMLAQTSVCDTIYKSVSEKITPTFTDNMNTGLITSADESEISKTLALPKVVISRLLKDYDAGATESQSNTEITRAVDNIARSITMMILGFIAAVILFILIKLLLFIVYRILAALSKLPIINGTNKFLGFLTGVINALFVIYIICAIVSFVATDNADVYRMVSETYIVKYFYNYNILLELFIKA